MGLWYSPFLLETAGVKEPPDAGSIPAPATRENTRLFDPYGSKSRFKTNRPKGRKRRPKGRLLWSSDKLHVWLATAIKARNSYAN